MSQRGPTGPFITRRWVLLGGGALAVSLLLTVAVGGMGRGPELPPRTIEDRDFARQADAHCARALPPLRRDRPERPEDAADEPALAGRVERTADRLRQLADELRALPVAPGDQADVERWLADWDAYSDIGQRFADALRRRDAEAYESVSAQGNTVSRRLFLFARANGMPRCVF